MIGARIQQVRVAVGMTRDEVVAALAVRGMSLTKAELSEHERGGSIPKATQLRALGKVLGVRAASFLAEPTVELDWFGSADVDQASGEDVPGNSARALLKLPPEERDVILARAAELVAEDYEEGGSLAGLEMFSEEDFFDDPVWQGSGGDER